MCGGAPDSARAQRECAEPRGRCPAASPASAILLLWLLGTGWVKRPGRRDSCWSRLLRGRRGSLRAPEAAEPAGSRTEVTGATPGRRATEKPEAASATAPLRPPRPRGFAQCSRAGSFREAARCRRAVAEDAAGPGAEGEVLTQPSDCSSERPFLGPKADSG